MDGRKDERREERKAAGRIKKQRKGWRLEGRKEERWEGKKK